MRCLLKNPDPDLKDLKQCEQLMAKDAIKKCKARPEPESESESEVSLHLQYIPIDPSPIVQCPRKSSQSPRLASMHKQATLKKKQMQVLVSMQALIANIIPLTSYNIGQYGNQFKCKYLILIPLMANVHNIGRIFTTKHEKDPCEGAVACDGTYTILAR